MPVQDSYQWLVIVGSLAAFLFGWGTGSNDVANAFGTSVGSGALTLKQAILIATIFEFTGAMVLGRVSTSTIAGGIADIKVFQKAIDCNGALVYGYGMMWTLILGGLWQGWASYAGLNVSATHSIIAGIIGFSQQFRRNGVLWITADPNSIPPYKGIVPIVITWFFAPIVTGVASGSIYLITRTFILRTENSYNKAYYLLPVFVFGTTWINIYFVFTKGAKKTFQEQGTGTGDDWSDSKAAWIAAVIAAGLSVTSYMSIPLVRKWVVHWADKEQLQRSEREARRLRLMEEKGIKRTNCEPRNSPSVSVDDIQRIRVADNEECAATRTIANSASNTSSSNLVITEQACYSESSSNSIIPKTEIRVLEIPPDIMTDPIGNIKAQWKNLLNFDYGMDYFDDLNEMVKEMHDRAEKFDPMTEKVFGFLQIFSATCVMFAHGAGEVGYMAGPLATIYDVYQTGSLSSKVNAPTWVIVISATSLVAGLATYGRNVVKAVGKDMAKITPSRGFAAELATAMVIMVASQYGLPTSSSQCITGGIVGIGIAEGLQGVNWRFFFQTFSSWVMTMVVMGLGTALMFAQGHNAP